MHGPSHRSACKGATVRRVVPLVLALAGLLLALAGCGSATNDYRGKVADVQQKYEQQMTDLTTQGTTDINADPAAAAATFTQLATVVSQFAEDVDAIKPPEDRKQ